MLQLHSSAVPPGLHSLQMLPLLSPLGICYMTFRAAKLLESSMRFDKFVTLQSEHVPQRPVRALSAFSLPGAGLDAADAGSWGGFQRGRVHLAPRHHWAPEREVLRRLPPGQPAGEVGQAPMIA